MPAPFLIRTVGTRRFLINADDHYRAVGGGRAPVQRVAERYIRPVKKTRSRQELACIVPSVFIRYMVAATAFPQPQADSSRDSVMFFHADLKYMTVSYWHHFKTQTHQLVQTLLRVLDGEEMPKQSVFSGKLIRRGSTIF